MSHATADVRVERAGARANVTLAKPPLNILDRPLNRALAQVVRELAADPAVAVIVLDGGEARGFSAGVEVADHTPERVEVMLGDFHSAIHALWSSDCVSIAAVHGFAQGGGFELAVSCDLVVAESNAKLGLPEIALGCYPPVAAALLPARAGWATAAELVLSGEPITVERAVTLGLVNRSCAPGTLAAEVDALAAPLLAKSPAVLREAKRALREGADRTRDDALAAIERRYLGSLMRLADADEGIRAFMEKRKPKWRNG